MIFIVEQILCMHYFTLVAAYIWCNYRYLKLFGVRLTKEDHINLVELLFQLVVIPDQEIAVTNVFASTFDRLLKLVEYCFSSFIEIYLPNSLPTESSFMYYYRGRKLLSPDDLSLPWRPVHQLWKSVFDSKSDSYGQRFLPP